MLLETGAQGICLELDVPDDLVLLSQFEMWVLNGWFIPFDGTSQRAAEGRDVWDAEKLKSWGRIFELEWEAESFWKPSDDRGIQATFPLLEYSWVKGEDLCWRMYGRY